MPLPTKLRLPLILAPALLAAACAEPYYAGPLPPPPPGWHGEGWGRHVARCSRRFPHYDPRTDLVYRRGQSFPCPL